ncbi:sensor domain-containing diguanylate cyclase [Phreatobacter sp. AB_2022a]|uniref:sensor domain-containing diguanylate cyclase n=1 Tax=Phreatobacter sp. AB_2022a TaxID=3003134 RepID=UPI0022871C20|nr:sensor domain-containing diguanylate cyclase [Phreatobacter sp. AB_2022a]MCZ0734679.1 diguanylate cyclase [Phreatobacter sp. AB_2022a]
MYREIHEVGIEERAHAPAIAGLLAVWTGLHARYGYAPFDPFDPQELGPDADDLIVMVPIGDADYVYVHQGANVRAAVGLDMTGRRTSDVAGASGSFFREVYNRVLADQRPLFTLHRGTIASDVHLWERLILPCRDSDGSQVIVVFSKPREFRDDLLSAILDASLDGILAVRIIRDAEGRPVDGSLIAANRRAAQFLGRSADDLADGRLIEAVPGMVEAGIWQRCVGVAETRTAAEFTVPYTDEFGERWFEMVAAPLGDGFMINFADITQRRMAEEAAELKRLEYAAANEALRSEIARRQALEIELSRLAAIDSLTGTLNRRALTEGLQAALAEARRETLPISVVLIDLDHFKAINDTFGHAGGDAVLKQAVRTLTEGLRAQVDLLGRLGGEEFVLVFPGLDIAEAMAAAERARAALGSAQAWHESIAIRCTASFGVACWDGRESMDRLLSRADHALYRAKAAGRNMVLADNGHWSGRGTSPDADVGLVPGADIVPFKPSTRGRGRRRTKSSADQA